jgi:hypothetical protein
MNCTTKLNLNKFSRLLNSQSYSVTRGVSLQDSFYPVLKCNKQYKKVIQLLMHHSKYSPNLAIKSIALLMKIDVGFVLMEWIVDSPKTLRLQGAGLYPMGWDG